MPKIFKIDRTDFEFGKRKNWEAEFRQDMIEILKKSQDKSEELAFSVFYDEETGQLWRSYTCAGKKCALTVPRERQEGEYLGSFHTRLEKEKTRPSLEVLFLKEIEWAGEEEGKICIGYAGLEKPTILCYEIDWDAINSEILDDFTNNILDLQDLEYIKEKEVRTLKDLDAPDLFIPIDRSAILHYITDEEGEPKEDFSIEEFLDALDERIHDIKTELDEDYNKELVKYIKEKVLWRDEKK